MTTQISGDTGVSQCQPNSVSQDDLQTGVVGKGGTVAPSTGLVGELLSVVSPTVNVGSAGAPSNMANIVIQPGVWDIQVYGDFVADTTNCVFQRVSGSLVSGAVGDVSRAQTSGAIGQANGQRVIGQLSRHIFTVPTTVYLVAEAVGGGVNNCTAYLTARRAA